MTRSARHLANLAFYASHVAVVDGATYYCDTWGNYDLVRDGRLVWHGDLVALPSATFQAIFAQPDARGRLLPPRPTASV